MHKLCGNSHKSAILDPTKTNDIPYERSISQLSYDMLNINLG